MLLYADSTRACSVWSPWFAIIGFFRVTTAICPFGTRQALRIGKIVTGGTGFLFTAAFTVCNVSEFVIDATAVFSFGTRNGFTGGVIGTVPRLSRQGCSRRAAATAVSVGYDRATKKAVTISGKTTAILTFWTRGTRTGILAEILSRRTRGFFTKNFGFCAFCF